MNHHRYGDLAAVWGKTHGRCHLCHDVVDLGTYGQVDLYGRDAATVDHIEPQSFGGDDHQDNLLPAHHGCNASRGTRWVEDARLQLAGTSSAPMSTGERVVVGTAMTGGGALLGGTLFATEDAHGNKQFNKNAAFWGGAAGLGLALLFLS